jgi:SAM-dependent methyltransferase
MAAEITRVSEVELNAACDRLRGALTGELDVQYFLHEPRCRRNMQRISELLPRGSTLLDIGSHYLHQSALLSILGYKVIAMDVPAFADIDAIRRRADEFDIHNVGVDHFDRGDFLRDYDHQIDFIVFTEIQEHITFNPVRFWRRVYELLRVSGRIYLTTPNGVRPWAVASTIKNALLLRGIGVPVPNILSEVTYGHHWKEYSSYEIRQLFATLSPDFNVRIEFYQDRPYEQWRGIKSTVRDVTRRLSAMIPPLREEIEAVITLTGRTDWNARGPDFF